MSKDDVSLDDELLLVTEKKKAVVQKKSKDTSPKRDEDEGEASGSGGEDNSDHKSNKRKPKSEPKKPLKKRKTGESSDESSDDEVYDDGWDDDLMGDDEDRAKLNGMAMIEREAILDERYTKRKEGREAWAVKRRLKQEQRDRDRRERRESKDTSRDSQKDREIRDRGTKKLDSKGKALSELKKKRAKAGYKKSDSEEEEGEVEETKGDDDDEYEPKKKSTSSSSSSSDSHHHASKSSKSKEDDSSSSSSRAKERVDRSDDDDITLEEVEKIRLNRETLEKWVDKPFFSTLIPGFFVRIGIGMDPASRMNVYRLAEIESVQIKTSYVLNGKQTNKWLKLMIGDKSKEFRMETISNRPVTESEYKHWKMQMERATLSLPTSEGVPGKVATLAIAKDYRYTSEDIQKMLKEKEQAGSLPIKLGAEKARLAILRDTCTNVHEKAKLEKQIAEIDEKVKERERKRVNTASVSNINQRNKQYNFITTLESKAEEKSGNSDTDPFSRRRTLPRITYASKHKVEDEESIVTTPPPSSSPIPETNGTNGNTSSSSESSSTNGNPLQGSTGVPEVVKTSEHDTIDLDIPLTSSTPASSRPFHSHLSSVSSSSSLSSSSSQPEKKKATLSLDDYMRRRKAME